MLFARNASSVSHYPPPRLPRPPRLNPTLNTPWRALAAFAGCLLAAGPAPAEPDARVFAGPPATFAVAPPIPTPPPVAASAADVLRWIVVEERMNVARTAAPVRAPVFFHEGEIASPHELALVEWPSRQPLHWQGDDVRAAATGTGLARLHLWFEVDLAPRQTRLFALVRTSPGGEIIAAPLPTAVPAATAESTADRLVFTAGPTTIAFHRPTAAGAPLAALGLAGGPQWLFEEGAGPSVVASDGDGETTFPAPAVPFLLSWAIGPVFAKIVAEWPAAGPRAAVRQEYRLFRDGTVQLAQIVTPPHAQPFTVQQQSLLTGVLHGPAEAMETTVLVPAVLNPVLRDVHAYRLQTIGRTGGNRAWLVVPSTVAGDLGRVHRQDPRFTVTAPGGLARGDGPARPDLLRAFWHQVTFAPVAVSGDPATPAHDEVLRAAQPLVAAVELPGLGAALAAAEFAALGREIQTTSWMSQVAAAALRGRDDAFPTRVRDVDSTVADWVRGVEEARNRITEGGTRPLAEHEKGRAAAGLDPYHITYGEVVWAWWQARAALPPPVARLVRTRMAAVRHALGRTDEWGWPYLDVFHRAQNMQMGPPLLALGDPEQTAEVRQYFRDLLNAPHLHAVGPGGQRPYAGRPHAEIQSSDALYQAVVDFCLRATELVAREDLGLHPAAYGQYLDTVDVNTDLFHPHAGRADEPPIETRANFFRAQAHVHRWLSWGPGPAIALLRGDAVPGVRIGATEAWHFAHARRGRWINWAELGHVFLSAKLPELAGLDSNRPAPRPPAVAGLTQELRRDGVRLRWSEVPGAAGYRIYRLRPGQPPFWINSPYARGGALITAHEYLDAYGQPGDSYRVHAVDREGRESPW
jgi:hypothetical protein